MNIKPLKNDVLFKKIESNLLTESGIILHNPIEVDRAVAISIGPDVTQIAPNDVFIADWTKLKKVDEEYYIISENEIVVVIGEHFQ